MRDFHFDFYNNTSLKSYDLNENIRYQLSVLDSLDAFTRRHSDNVANLTCRLCEKLHMKSYFTVYCTTCAYLHDVGKQFIPPEILQKKGRLTDEEYDVIKTHTTIGYKICMNDLKLRPFANGALYHHEALNGSGYPNGYTSKDIPIEGKIIRVADEFDAIVSKRQYKSHVGICDTLKILLDESKVKSLKPTKKGKKSTEKLTDSTTTPKGAALQVMKEGASKKVNKIHPKIFRALVKIVIDDTNYELYCLDDYLKYLQENVQRIEQIMSYRAKANNAKKESDKKFFLEGIKVLIQPGETMDNLDQVYQEYKEAIVYRHEHANQLKKELREIKKIK